MGKALQLVTRTIRVKVQGLKDEVAYFLHKLNFKMLSVIKHLGFYHRTQFRADYPANEPRLALYSLAFPSAFDDITIYGKKETDMVIKINPFSTC